MAQRYHMDADFPGWPRRPTLEAAAALYFLACVGRVALNLAGYLVALAFPGLDGQGVNWGLNLLYQAGFLLLPVARYCQERPGMGTGLRLRRLFPGFFSGARPAEARGAAHPWRFFCAPWLR